MWVALLALVRFVGRYSAALETGVGGLLELLKASSEGSIISSFSFTFETF